jgi:hypothetical protein
MGIDFSNQPTSTLNSLASGTLTDAANRAEQTLTVSKNMLYEFLLRSDAGAGGAWTETRMEIVDASGRVVFRLSAYSGMPAASGHVYLAAGTYTVRYTAAGPDGAALLPTAYTLLGRIISDPIGPTSTTTGSTGTGTSTWTTTTTTSVTTTYTKPAY